MLIAEDDDVVETLSSDAAEEALAVSIHHRSLHCSAHHAGVDTVGGGLEIGQVSSAPIAAT